LVAVLAEKTRRGTNEPTLASPQSVGLISEVGGRLQLSVFIWVSDFSYKESGNSIDIESHQESSIYLDDSIISFMHVPENNQTRPITARY
jgi:hypothetical protein